MAINGSILISAGINESLATPENHSGEILTSIQQSYAFTDGTGAGQNDLVWQDRLTLGTLATTTIDLSGALTDVFGNVILFTEVTSIVIRNRETVATAILLWGPNSAANPFLWTFADASDRLAVAPSGGYGQWTDTGSAVGAGASDTLYFENQSAAVTLTFDITIVGRSA